MNDFDNAFATAPIPTGDDLTDYSRHFYQAALDSARKKLEGVPVGYLGDLVWVKMKCSSKAAGAADAAAEAVRARLLRELDGSPPSHPAVHFKDGKLMPPPVGEWHRQDFTPEMLEGELVRECWEIYQQYLPGLETAWDCDRKLCKTFRAAISHALMHRKPKPAPVAEVAVEEWVQLGPQDTPPGSVIRGAGEIGYKGWCLITSCSETGIRIWRHSDSGSGSHHEITWRSLMEGGTEISRDNGQTWQSCKKRKEAAQ